MTKKSRFGRFLTSIALIAGFFAFSAPQVQAVATTVYADSVNGSDSSGNGTAGSPFQTFHKAYTTAVSGDTIDLTGTFTWTNAGETGDAAGSGYTISKNLTIQGQSRSTIVQAAATRNSADRMVFFINAGATVTMRNLTVRHGRVTGQGQGGGITLYGTYCGQSGQCPGTTGTLTLDQVDVTKNDATTALNTYTYDRAGGVMMQENANLTVLGSNIEDNNCICKYYAAGGIYVGMQSGTLTITNSSVSQNTVNSDGGSTYAYDYTSVAGGLASQRFSKITITNSTFYGNSTNSYGGAMSLYYTDRGARLTNVTIVGNSATLGAGGILWNQLYTGGNYDLRMKNVLLANNTGVSGAANDFYAKDSTSGTASIATYSIIESSTNKTFSGTGIVTGNQSSLDVDTGIAENGAANGSHTLALLASSVAVNAGDSAAHGYTGNTVTPPATDQRGSARVGIYDIGAYEYGSAVSTTTTAAPTTTSSSTTTTTAAPSTTSSSTTTTTAAPATTVASSSTTTIAGSSTSSTAAPATTVAANQSTVAPSSTDVTATTQAPTATTIPPIQTASSSTDVLARGAAPATTLAPSSTTTTTTTTVVKPPALPDAATITLGEAATVVNGESVATTLTRVNNTLVLTSGTIKLVIAAVDQDGNVLPLDANGNIRLTENRLLTVTASNLAASAGVQVWVFSTPTKVGDFTTSTDGGLKETISIPKTVANGAHRLVLTQKSKRGNETLLAVGIAIGAKNSRNWSLGWILFPPLGVASVLALVLPARRRRRNAATA